MELENSLKEELNMIRSKYNLELSDKENLESIIENLTNDKIKSKELENESEIIKISDYIKDYSIKKIRKIYKKTLLDGYYIDQNIILFIKNKDKLLKSLVITNIKNSKFVQRVFEKDELINIFLEDKPKEKMIDNLLKRKNPFKSIFNLKFKKILITKDNESLYIAYRKNMKDRKNFYKKILEKYENYIIEKGLSKNTLKNYMSDIRLFLRWIDKKNIDIYKLNRKKMIKYRDYIYEKYAIKSIEKIIFSILNFNEFLNEKGYIKKKIIFPQKDIIKDLSEKKVEVFDEKQQKKIIETLNNDILSSRGKIITRILYYTGIRASETTEIKIKDIDFENLELVVIGKGKRIRTIPIKKELSEYLEKYIKNCRINSKYAKESQYLLVSQRAKKIARDTVRKDIKPLEKVIDAKVFPHKFRHTFATNLVQRGVEISTISRLLGHADIQTTINYYVNTSRENKLNAINKL
mgnify:CR=1 FL=1